MYHYILSDKGLKLINLWSYGRYASHLSLPYSVASAFSQSINARAFSERLVEFFHERIRLHRRNKAKSSPILRMLFRAVGLPQTGRRSHADNSSASVALPLNPAHCALSDVCGTVQLAGVMRHAERAVAARMVK